jgi:hypothetical protein
MEECKARRGIGSRITTITGRGSVGIAAREVKSTPVGPRSDNHHASQLWTLFVNEYFCQQRCLSAELVPNESSMHPATRVRVPPAGVKITKSFRRREPLVKVSKRRRLHRFNVADRACP